jgi:AcrR family transcriptional regulator
MLIFRVFSHESFILVVYDENMTDENIMRKTPQQNRSKQRVQHVLDIAERLFAEMGYEASTTNAIAEHANVSIGWLYQFFPNKEAIRDALIERYIQEMRETKAHDGVQDLPLAQVIKHLIQNTLAFSVRHGAFEEMFMSQFAHSIHHEIVENVENIVRAYFPQLSTPVQHQTAVYGVAIVKGVMTILKNHPMPIESAVDESVLIIMAYLRAVLLREGIAVPTDIA